MAEQNIKGSTKCEKCGCRVWLTPKGKLWKHNPTDGGKVTKGKTECGKAAAP